MWRRHASEYACGYSDLRVLGAAGGVWNPDTALALAIEIELQQPARKRRVHIHDDADGSTIAKETISAAKECARMIGKIGPRFTQVELDEMEEAAQRLMDAIALKKQLRAGQQI